MIWFSHSSRTWDSDGNGETLYMMLSIARSDWILLHQLNFRWSPQTEIDHDSTRTEGLLWSVIVACWLVHDGQDRTEPRPIMQCRTEQSWWLFRPESIGLLLSELIRINIADHVINELSSQEVMDSWMFPEAWLVQVDLCLVTVFLPR